MNVTRYKNYRFSLELDTLDIIFSSLNKYEYIKTVGDVTIRVLKREKDENSRSNDTQSTLEDFYKSKFFKLLNIDSVDEVFKITTVGYEGASMKFALKHSTPISKTVFSRFIFHSLFNCNIEDSFYSRSEYRISRIIQDFEL